MSARRGVQVKGKVASGLLIQTPALPSLLVNTHPAVVGEASEPQHQLPMRNPRFLVTDKSPSVALCAFIPVVVCMWGLV